jgi:hypothetical protein
MMGYRYWTVGRQRADKSGRLGTKRSVLRGDGVDPEAAGDCLPLSTAVPLWGVFSMLGWLMVIYAGVYLVGITSYLWPPKPYMAMAEPMRMAIPADYTPDRDR